MRSRSKSERQRRQQERPVAPEPAEPEPNKRLAFSSQLSGESRLVRLMAER